jgi:hypothetical protein
MKRLLIAMAMTAACSGAMADGSFVTNRFGWYYPTGIGNSDGSVTTETGTFTTSGAGKIFVGVMNETKTTCLYPGSRYCQRAGVYEQQSTLESLSVTDANGAPICVAVRPMVGYPPQPSTTEWTCDAGTQPAGTYKVTITGYFDAWDSGQQPAPGPAPFGVITEYSP